MKNQNEIKVLDEIKQIKSDYFHFDLKRWMVLRLMLYHCICLIFYYFFINTLGSER